MKIEKLNFLDKTDYYIHCQGCKEALHSCGNGLIIYNNIIYCIACEEVYKPNHIKMFCAERSSFPVLALVISTWVLAPSRTLESTANPSMSPGRLISRNRSLAPYISYR